RVEVVRAAGEMVGVLRVQGGHAAAYAQAGAGAVDERLFVPERRRLEKKGGKRERQGARLRLIVARVRCQAQAKGLEAVNIGRCALHSPLVSLALGAGARARKKGVPAGVGQA